MPRRESGDWLADLVEVGQQARAIMRRHPWLVVLITTRPVLGPNGLALLEHVLDVLDRHPAEIQAKLEAFAMLNAITVLFVQNELAGGSATPRRNAAYLLSRDNQAITRSSPGYLNRHRQQQPPRTNGTPTSSPGSW